MAIFSVDPKTARRAGCSVGFETDLVMQSNAKPSINPEIFLDYVRTVALLNLAELLRLDKFPAELAVIAVDNRPSHIISDVIALFSPGQVRVITFAPHTIQIFQSPRDDPVWCSQTAYKI
jgi:hypothetical protein